MDQKRALVQQNEFKTFGHYVKKAHTGNLKPIMNDAIQTSVEWPNR